jgi:hypothetical protein
VDLDKDDIEWLWRELTLLFDPYSKEKQFNQTRKITLVTGKGRDRREIQETDLESLLRSGFVRGRVTQLNFSLFAAYSDSLGTLQSLDISMVFDGGADVRISGSKDWIQRVRGLLDDFLNQRKSKNTRPRLAAFCLLLFGLPFSAGYVIAPHAMWDTSQFLSAVALGAFFLSLPIWGAAKMLYPVPTIAIGLPVEWPWYVKWAHQVLVVVVLSIVGTIVVSALIK